MRKNVQLGIFAVALLASVTSLGLGLLSSNQAQKDASAALTLVDTQQSMAARLAAAQFQANLLGASPEHLSSALSTTDVADAIQALQQYLNQAKLENDNANGAATGAAADVLSSLARSDAASNGNVAALVAQNQILTKQLADLHQQLVEALTARIKSPAFDWSLFASLIATLASVSGIAIAWRKDHREVHSAKASTS